MTDNAQPIERATVLSERGRSVITERCRVMCRQRGRQQMSSDLGASWSALTLTSVPSGVVEPIGYINLGLDGQAYVTVDLMETPQSGTYTLYTVSSTALTAPHSMAVPCSGAVSAIGSTLYVAGGLGQQQLWERLSGQTWQRVKVSISGDYMLFTPHRVNSLVLVPVTMSPATGPLEAEVYPVDQTARGASLGPSVSAPLAPSTGQIVSGADPSANQLFAIGWPLAGGSGATVARFDGSGPPSIERVSGLTMPISAVVQVSSTKLVALGEQTQCPNKPNCTQSSAFFVSGNDGADWSRLST